MSWTQSNLDIAIANSQCCAVNMANKLVQYIMNGDVNADCLKMEFFALMNLINSLKDYDITTSCLSDPEICTLVTRIQHICSECC